MRLSVCHPPLSAFFLSPTPYLSLISVTPHQSLGLFSVTHSFTLFFLFGASWDAFFGARVLIGVAAGIATGVVPLYLSEICPSSTRAAVGTAHQLGIASGLLLSQLLTSPELCPLGRLGLGLGLANPNPNLTLTLTLT